MENNGTKSANIGLYGPSRTMEMMEGHIENFSAANFHTYFKVYVSKYKQISYE